MIAESPSLRVPGPFVEARSASAELGPLELAQRAVPSLLKRHEVDPATIQAIAYGAVVRERARPNLAREIVLGSFWPPCMKSRAAVNDFS